MYAPALNPSLAANKSVYDWFDMSERYLSDYMYVKKRYMLKHHNKVEC